MRDSKSVYSTTIPTLGFGNSPVNSFVHDIVAGPGGDRFIIQFFLQAIHTSNTVTTLVQTTLVGSRVVEILEAARMTLYVT